MSLHDRLRSIPIAALTVIAALALGGCRREAPETVVTGALGDEDSFLAAAQGLTLAERRGRALFLKATAGNALVRAHPVVGRFAHPEGGPPSGRDLERFLGLGTRLTRFEDFGVVNDPDCRPGTNTSFGFDICKGDEGPEGLLRYVGKTGWRDPACDLDESDLRPARRQARGNPCALAFGTSAGVLGLRKFPNPRFRRQAWKGWEAYDPADPAQEPPFLVGVSCAACHAGFAPGRTPEDPNLAQWSEVWATGGHPFAGQPGRRLGPGSIGRLPAAASELHKLWQEAWDSLSICRQCPGRRGLSTRSSDLARFLATRQRPPLYKVLGMAPAALIESKWVGGRTLWERGRKVYEAECVGCHGDSRGHKTVARVPLQKVGLQPCTIPDPSHGRRFPAPGWIRVPALVGIWGEAPFLHNRSVGPELCRPGEGEGVCQAWSPDVKTRLALFDAAMQALVDPAARRGHVRTLTEPRELRLGNRVLALPAGIPARLVESLDGPALERHLAKRATEEAPGKDSIQAWRMLVSRLGAKPDLLVRMLTPFARCAPVAEDVGHEFGFELKNGEKKALAAFLKTL